MTIRRRLYISNILMIVLPVLICMLVVCIISGILMNALGIARGSFRSGSIDFLQSTQHVAAEWADDATADQIELSLAGVRNTFPKNGAALSIYRGSQAMYALGTSSDSSIDIGLLAQGGDHAYLVDSTVVIVENEGAYTLVGVRENHTVKRLFESVSEWHMFFLFLLALGGMAAIILLVNLLLTRMIFKHIMQPLTTLVDGVHQIADGNLSYRIYYEGKDEFVSVIDDFNDMAIHLQAMVNARQKDDESRRELIAGISHDLRTPLTSILGYVEGLEEGVAATPAMQSRYLAIIHEQANILSYTLNQLFLLTKLDTDSFPMHMERVDLAAELDTYVQGISETYAGKGLSIHMQQPLLPPLWVQIDRVQLHNVLTNIVENSVKYSTATGGHMEITCARDGQNATATLTDDGPGVAEASLEKLFSVFYRGDASRQNRKDGSGLGLTVSARIIQRLGGTIDASNASPHGLSIRITLPLAKEESSHANNIDR